MKAMWNEQVVAESNETIIVEGNHYFPIESVKQDFLVESSATTVCGCKGEANYYTLNINGKRNPDAAWYYADPKPEAEQIRGRVAFWKGVSVVE